MAIRCAAVCFVVAAVAGAAHAEADLRSIPVGDGRSMVIEYDRELRPIRKWTGFDRPVDVTVFADGSLLVVEEAAAVVLVDSTGHVRWREAFGVRPIRARPRPGGGFLVTALGSVVAVRPDLTVEWRRPMKGVRAAAPLPNGHILVTRQLRQGWVVELTPEGRTVWKSEACGGVDESAHWRDRPSPLCFRSVLAIDAAADGTIFTAVFDGNELRRLSPDRREVEVFAGADHVSDTRIGPAGELVAVAPETYLVWVRGHDGTVRRFEPPIRPLAASFSPAGNLFVALGWEPEREVLNATAERARGEVFRPWWQRGWPLPLVASFATLLFVGRIRAGGTRGGLRRAQAVAGSPPQAAPAAEPRPAITALLLCGVAAGAALALAGVAALEESASLMGVAWFAAGSMAAAIALRILDGRRASTLTSFLPGTWRRPQAPAGSGRIAVLAGIAVSMSVLASLLCGRGTETEAGAIALWLAAQVTILIAAWPPAATEKASRGELVALAAILVGATLARFWQIGFYPDYVHHDHAIVAEEALRMLRGDWQPFFSRVYSVGRPALLPMVAGLQAFGPEHWVIRLPSAIAGVVIVWASHLLARVLFNRRVALFAAILVAANNALLLYSRQPYVIDPAAPFVLAAYCAAAGLKRGSRFHGCAAGVLAAWALIGYHASVTYAAVAAAILAYLFCVHPRAAWRGRAIFTWAAAGALVVYLPMLLAEVRSAELAARTEAGVVLLAPDGSIRRDAELWAEQLGRSFGAVLSVPDSAPWVVSTESSICGRAGSVLFGIGLGYLLTYWRTPATFAMIAWAILCIGLGSATLPSPPTYYHMLAAVVPLMIISAVALDRLLAAAASWRPAWRKPVSAVALLVLGVVVWGHLDSVWRAVRRPPSVDGKPVFRADARVLAGRLIRAHPDWRYWLVRSPAAFGPTSDHPGLRFFAADSDLSDLSGDIEDVLPVPPVEPAKGAAFMVFPSRAADGERIARVYPRARVEEMLSDSGETLRTYMVTASDVREASKAKHR